MHEKCAHRHLVYEWVLGVGMRVGMRMGEEREIYMYINMVNNTYIRHTMGDA